MHPVTLKTLKFTLSIFKMPKVKGGVVKLGTN